MANRNDITLDFSWFGDAACKGLASDLFFEGFENASDEERQETIAICAGCPVKTQCYNFAENMGNADGFFAEIFWVKGKARNPMTIGRRQSKKSAMATSINMIDEVIDV